ncbi:MAG: hypothetical protein GY906_21820, partial [bacterium]|nr:hypothetical protein [bacterium]
MKCNRRHHAFADYRYLFGENFAGSAVLTEAMKSHTQIPPAKVREPRDVKNAGGYDILNDRDYEKHKKEVKDRVTFYEHFSPPCETMTLALRGNRERSVDAPYGHGVNEKVELHNKIAVRTCNLCRIKHSVGDAFSLEHIWPTDLMRFDCYKELLALPGIVAF